MRPRNLPRHRARLLWCRLCGPLQPLQRQPGLRGQPRRPWLLLRGRLPSRRRRRGRCREPGPGSRELRRLWPALRSGHHLSVPERPTRGGVRFSGDVLPERILELFPSRRRGWRLLRQAVRRHRLRLRAGRELRWCCRWRPVQPPLRARRWHPRPVLRLRLHGPSGPRQLRNLRGQVRSRGLLRRRVLPPAARLRAGRGKLRARQSAVREHWQLPHRCRRARRLLRTDMQGPRRRSAELWLLRGNLSGRRGLQPNRAVCLRGRRRRLAELPE